jgi:uncharacterized membrane protein YqhA
MRAVLERFRYVVALASLVLVVTCLATVGWSIALTVQFIGDLFDGGWRGRELTVDLLGIIDLILIATVQVVVAIGLWELFVGELSVPEWLRVDSLGKLKTALAELIVLVIAVKFAEKLINVKEPLDVLWYALGVSAVGLMLVALVVGTKAAKNNR